MRPAEEPLSVGAVRARQHEANATL
jgi:hypothetical protein